MDREEARSTTRDSDEYTSKTDRALFPVIHSILSPEALMTMVSVEYILGTPIACTLLRASRNDTYLLKTTDQQYIVRVYGTHWRTLAQIHYELDLLTYLSKKGISVSTALVQKGGHSTCELLAPEGTRHLVVFTHAAGVPLYGAGIEAHSHLFGRALAMLHRATDDFTSPHTPLQHTLAYLLDEPLERIQPFFVHRPAEWNSLQKLAAQLRARIMLVAPHLNWGICHGDPTSMNAFITEDHIITFFDFDAAGLGWRVNDLATVRDLARHRESEHLWKEFLRGYTELRTLNEAELEAIPLFVAVGDIWIMGSNVIKGTILGVWWQNEEYFDGMLKGLQAWVDQHILAN